MFSSLTGTTVASFDELFVRVPPNDGPLVPVLGGLDASGLSGLQASVDASLLTKRDVSDSFSSSELDTLLADKASVSALALKADAATHFTRTDTREIFGTVIDSTAALALKRDLSDSLSTSETSALLGAKVDESVHQSAISLKQDEEGSLTKQTANLYQTKVDASAALELKRDVADSYSASPGHDVSD
jgi:hypothetical protein